MRLLDAHALIYDNVARLVEFPDATRAPRYAILSHTWEEEEVLFEDIALGPQHEITTHTGPRQDLRFKRSSTRADDPWSRVNFRTDSDVESMSIGSDNGDFDKTESVSMSNDSSDDTVCDKTKSPLPNNLDAEALGLHVKAGWNKVLNACLLSLRDQLLYVWIDTCCIDKSSSAELSEAINSMFGWYKGSTKCYAYLNDCRIPSKPEWETILQNNAIANNIPERDVSVARYQRPQERTRECICVTAEKKPERAQHDHMYDLIAHCRWFTRGWTLQELIAPVHLRFYDRRWQMIARRREILLTLEAITSIHKEALDFQLFYGYPALSKFSVAQRMHWASSRRTTRKEDEAYCLLGVFGINMSLLYGEGARAFRRLQMEIMKTTADQSILAWEIPGGNYWITTELLAYSASCFQGAARNIAWAKDETSLGSEYRMTPLGLEIELWIDKDGLQRNCMTQIAVLDCIYEHPGGHSHRVGILLTCPPDELTRLQSGVDGPCSAHILRSRVGTVEKPTADWRLLRLPLSWTSRPQLKRKLVLRPICDLSLRLYEEVRIRIDIFPQDQLCVGWRILAAYPRLQWAEMTSTLRLRGAGSRYGGIAVDTIGYGAILIVLGMAKGFHRSAGNVNSFRRLCEYWIVWESEIESEAPRETSSSTILNEYRVGTPKSASAPICALEKYEFFLEKLCERASTFASKDYFEHTTRRSDSHKSVLLPDGKVLTASFRESIDSSERNDPLGLDESLGSEDPLSFSDDHQDVLLQLRGEPISGHYITPSGEDYFRLRDIDQMFLAKLAERRKRSNWVPVLSVT